jgi:hypothetical protein
VNYKYPARGNLPPLRVTWYDGDKMPHKSLAPGVKLGKNGVLFIGDKATMYGTIEGKGGPAWQIIHPNARDFKAPAPTLARSKGHHQDWVNACTGGPAAPCNFDYAGPLTEAVLIGNLAVLTGRPLEWNSAALEITNDAQANEMLRREARKGWTV